jgi:DNA-binding transcriptional LysR family regulator
MRELETRLFRYFVALADEQHFGRAALNLAISPPTLTHQIQKLEKHVGVKLVERRGNTHVELTEAGRRFLTRARNVLREASEAEAAAHQAARGEVGRLEIGFMAVVTMAGMIEKFIGGFQHQNSGIEIVLRHTLTMDQINSILNRTLDFGFVQPPDHYPSGLQGFIVYREPMVIALPANHRLAGQSSVDPSSLKGESFINTSAALDVGFWKHLHAVGVLGGFQPNIVRRSKDVISMLSCVSAGQGVAIVSESFLRLDIPNVIYRRVKTDPPLLRSTALVYRSDDSSPAIQAFIKFMRHHELEPDRRP